MDFKSFMRNNQSIEIWVNLLWLFFDKVYGALFTLFIYSLLAKYLGKNLFGVWNYIVAFGTIIPALAGLGLNFIIVKKVKENPILAQGIMNTAFMMRNLAGILVGIIFFTIYLIIGINIENHYLYVTALVFVSQIFLNGNVFVFKNEAELNNKQTVISRNIALTIGCLLRYLGIKFDMNLIFFGLVNALEYAIFLSISFYQHSRTEKKGFKLEINKTICGFLFIRGLPLMLSAITVILYLKIDQLIIGYLLDNESVGVYAAASRITEMFYAVPVLISSVYYPRIVEMRKDVKKRKMVLRQFYFIIITLTSGLTFFVILSSKYIIEFLFGTEFSKASEVLVVYSWSILFMALLVSSSKYLLSIDRNDIIFKRSVMGLLSNVILNFVLIPRYGILGAAWSTLISYSIAAYFSNVFFKVLRPVMLEQALSVFYFLKLKASKNKV